MIHNPLAILFLLLSIEICVLQLSRHGRFKRYFRFLPPVFWIYFVPMLASTAGLTDTRSSVYSLIIAHLLPASLLLLLISVDVKSIIRLGGPAILMFFVGSLGIILGAPVVFFLFKNWVGAQSWSGFGALSASWTGGSANMIAVKEALNTPDKVFLPMVIVDTIVPYVWMGILLAMVRIQPVFDRWNHSNRQMLDQLNKRIFDISSSRQKQKWNVKGIILVLGLAILGSLISQFIAKPLPEIKYAVSTYAWTIIIVSALGILLSFTPVKNLENFGASKIGYFMLYFVLASIGAKANMIDIGSTFLLILAGFLIVFIHAGFLLVASRIIKAPLFLAVVASQANIGGVASAPVVAAVYQPGLASVGLLLAILGNIVGTYLGILSGQLCLSLTY
jgi:uncharacterized membrane protein